MRDYRSLSPTRGSINGYEPLGGEDPRKHAETRAYKVLLVLTCVSMFVCYGLVSAVSPFFPQFAAEHLGADNVMVGLAIAANPLMSVLCTPLAGWLCGALGRGPVLLAGSWTLAAGTFFFGVSDSIAFCIGARLVQGAGAALMIVAATALLIEGAPDLARALAIEELFVGLGFIMGPTLGGFLYDAGGFQATFIVMAALPAAFAMTVPWALRAAGQPLFERCSFRSIGGGGSRKGDAATQPLTLAHAEAGRGGGANGSNAGVNGASSGNGGGAAAAAGPPTKELSGWAVTQRVLGDRVVLACSGATFVGATVLGFLDPTLAQHVDLTMETSTKVTGLVFSLPAVLYAAGVKVAPGLVDRYGYRWVMVAGFLLEALSFVLLGPAPFLHPFVAGRTAATAAICTALLVYGLGVALVFIPALPAMKESLFRGSSAGSKDRDRMTNALSSVFNFANSGGEVVGPVLGSFAVEYLPRHREVACVGDGDRCDSGFVSACLWYAVALAGCAALTYACIPHGRHVRGVRRSKSKSPGRALGSGSSGTGGNGASQSPLPLGRGGPAAAAVGSAAGGPPPLDENEWETDSASSDSLESDGFVGGGRGHASVTSLNCMSGDGGSGHDYLVMAGDDDEDDDGTGDDDDYVDDDEDDDDEEAEPVKEFEDDEEKGPLRHV